MRKNFVFLACFFVALAIIAWSLAFVFAKTNSAYGYNVNGLLVQSNDFNPKTYFAELGNSKNFVVSPAMHEPVSPADSAVFSAANVFSVILNGNDKNVTMLIRVLDSGNNIYYCLSNFADVKKSEQVSRENCLAELSSDEKTKILVESPDNSIAMPFALLEKNKIFLKTQNANQLSNSALIVSSIMYLNSGEIINKSNALVNKVLSGK